jgi:hypothetical protein
VTTFELIRKLERRLAAAQPAPATRGDAECADVIEDTCCDMLADLYAGGTLERPRMKLAANFSGPCRLSGSDPKPPLRVARLSNEVTQCLQPNEKSISRTLRPSPARSDWRPIAWSWHLLAEALRAALP